MLAFCGLRERSSCLDFRERERERFRTSSKPSLGLLVFPHLFPSTNLSLCSPRIDLSAVIAGASQSVTMVLGFSSSKIKKAAREASESGSSSNTNNNGSNHQGGPSSASLSAAVAPSAFQASSSSIPADGSVEHKVLAQGLPSSSVASSSRPHTPASK